MKGNIGVEFDHMNLETKRFSFALSKLFLSFWSAVSLQTILLYFDRKLTSLLPDCTLVDISKVTAGQRMIKSKEEIEVKTSFLFQQPHLPLQTSLNCCKLKRISGDQAWCRNC